MKTKYAALVAGIALVGGANAQITITEYYTLDAATGQVQQRDAAGAAVGSALQLRNMPDTSDVTGTLGLSYDGTFFYSFNATSNNIDIWDAATGVQTAGQLSSGFTAATIGEDFAVTASGVSSLLTRTGEVQNFDLAGTAVGSIIQLQIPNGNNLARADGLAYASVDDRFYAERLEGEIRRFVPSAGNGSATLGITIDPADGFAVHQFVTIPEPSSALLLGLGGLGLLARRKR